MPTLPVTLLCAEAIASLQRLEKYMLLEEHEEPPKSKTTEARFVSRDWIGLDWIGLKSVLVGVMCCFQYVVVLKRERPLRRAC